MAAATVRFMQCAFLSVALLALSATGSSTGHSRPGTSVANAEQLKTGRFLYRTIMNGKDAGTSEISISKAGPDNFVFTNHVSGAFAQVWEAVTTTMFVPVSAKLSSGEGDKLRPRFELNCRNGRAIGWRIEKLTGNKAEVDVKVLPDTVDQRIDCAAAMPQDLVPMASAVMLRMLSGTRTFRISAAYRSTKVAECANVQC